MTSLVDWAVPQLGKLLPLDAESLKQIVTYTDSLSRPAAADHLRNLLGDSPQALEFITSFQSRRPAPPSDAISSSSSNNAHLTEVPRPAARPKKAKQPFNKLPPPRQVEPSTNVPGAYMKKPEDDYIPTSNSKEAPLSNTLALQTKPDAIQAPTTSSQPIRLPPSAAGPLISDILISQTSSPSKASQPKTRINLTGGTPMRGAASTLTDLDSAIRQLEVSANPSLRTNPADTAARRCNCMAQRHELLAAAPNCLNCGKIICAKEGLGPCTYCDSPILSPGDIQVMLRTLREERGREKTNANNASHKRAEVAKVPRPFTASSPPSSGTSTPDDSLSSAKAHRDKLLAFQANNAKRTRVHDEAADFETPDMGVSAWASPQERALQLKRQQRVLREQEWSARPEYEKRQIVVSLDVDSKGRGRAVKKIVAAERSVKRQGSGELEDEWKDEMGHVDVRRGGGGDNGKATGNFSRNPLLGSLIRPVYTPMEEKGKEKAIETPVRSVWRRVQDDADNESVILDGGAYGGNFEGRELGSEELTVGS